MAKKKQQSIPPELLARVNEFSTGGFLLFTFDTEGSPRINSDFDSKAHAQCMQYFLSRWVEAVDCINRDTVAGEILRHTNRKRK